MISVCMATYNGEKFIKEQIDSILSQLDSNDELIISDDGSTDKTLEIIAAFNDKRIKVLNHAPPHGVIFNFENALNHTSGDYIFLSDQDDMWLPGRKEKVLAKFASGYQLILTNAKVIDSSNRCIHESFMVLNHSQCGFWNNFKHNSFLGCCMAFTKETLSVSLPFPKNIAMHDWWIGLVLLITGTKYTFIEEVLHCYRKHGNNVSNSGEASPYCLSKKIFIRIQMAFSIIARLIKIFLIKFYLSRKR